MDTYAEVKSDISTSNARKRNHSSTDSTKNSETQGSRRKSRRLSGLGPEQLKFLNRPSSAGKSPEEAKFVEKGGNEDFKPCQSFFSNIFESASLLTVEVEQCVALPKFSTRPMTHFGVERLKRSFLGDSQ